MSLSAYKSEFIELLVKAEALKFGTFTLKSGRIAPYFLNVGSFYTGELMHQLSRFYAQAYLDSGIEVEVIFGPAYKGIPLSVATTCALYSEFKENISFCFNRKEAKNYGDAKGNPLVGAPLNEKTRVLLIDDVITAGTAIRESVELLRENGNPQIAGVLIAMNRMEKNNDGQNALEEVEKILGVKVFSIVNLNEVIEVLYNREVGGQIYIDDEKMEMIKKYREEYGV
ncbi:MAG: orotate phosphoribosyltransferase, orotate phosphoribosyltransferase [Candidatus Peregrinibacteria bacterium GW2011_GWE2_39_6]|nr:MAG: orotate phosphoribosyltransferase, orotate phosphoribosyltransferase [Candidatus Peregrinibacteria bacterium GW2011_GWF2_39_17]KKR24583.1 MAG: orotate phosphoribosyltransferase, orotate phosphoribosyltransferase [Candidatus Peregrinibacteria bacterium GW2011_GWE2_39_6]HCW32688.1 orotate phosphoribosyltransferase [Candidatus Peregrinibacteria bacterium]